MYNRERKCSWIFCDFVGEITVGESPFDFTEEDHMFFRKAEAEVKVEVLSLEMSVGRERCSLEKY